MVEITADVNKFHSLGILGMRDIVLLLLRGMEFYIPDGALDYITRGGFDVVQIIVF